MLEHTVHQFLVLSFWKILAIIHFLLAFVLRIIPKLRKIAGPVYEIRYQFEINNLKDQGSQSYFLENKVADLCFQFSSEGEYEQVRWFVEELIHQNKLIELIFTSPSVEAKIKKLYNTYPDQVRYLRTPIVALSTKDLSHWITAKSIIMVRYDFYPMIMSLFYEKKLILIWFFRSQGKKGLLANFKWSLILPLMEYVVSSNSDDWWWLRGKISYKNLMPVATDFRSLTILKRIHNKQVLLNNHFPHFEKLIHPILSNGTSVIHGNAYGNELSYLADLNWQNQIKSQCITLAIVAHHVDAINVQKIEDHYQLPAYVINSGISLEKLKSILVQWREKPGVFIFNGKGFLLELYAEFKVALVGGGFFSHTHSILEPFLAGCTVYCGPNIQRSSEYYQAKALNDKKVFSLATIEQWRSEGLNKIHQLNITNVYNTIEQSNLMSYDTMKVHAQKLMEKLLKN